MNYETTRHADKRLQQRGIQRSDLHLILRFGSRAILHKGRELLSLGREGRQDLETSGFGRQRLDRLQRTVLVLAPEGDLVVTAAKLSGGKGRRYLRSKKR